MAILYPQPKSLEGIIQSKRYIIPTYQRPYSWIEQVSELWYDIKDNEPPYFAGILMLRSISEDNKAFEVIDGQQRLATLLLLLRAAVLTIETDDLEAAHEIQNNYINQKRPLTQKPQLTLEMSRRDKDKFESLMLGNTLSSRKRFSSWNNMDKAVEFFLEKFKELKTNEGLDGIKSFVREKVLELRFIDVHVEKDSDIYLFFETLNDRGMDLSIADLVKNSVCAMANREVDLDVDDAARKIDDISDLIGTGNMKSFLLHYCWAKADDENPPPRKSLMNWYGTTIHSAKKQFLIDLEENAIRYADFIDPSKISREADKKEVLTFLKILNATRCYPLLLQGDEHLSTKDFIRLCKAIEILTFRHSTITKRDAKILEGVYYNQAKEIRKGTEINKILAELKKHAQKISIRAFEAGFVEYEPEHHQIGRYVLLKIESDEKSLPLDWDRLTLEHVLAGGLTWDGRDQYLDRLGNLTLLSGPLNKEVANKEFKIKKEEYKKEKRFQLTKDLIKYSDFTKDSIIKRQEQFSLLAEKIWSPDKII